MVDKNFQQLSSLPSQHHQNEFLIEIVDVPVADFGNADLYAQSTSMPGPTVETSQRDWGGHRIQYPAYVDRTGEWEVTFANHLDFKMRRELANWDEAIDDPTTSTGDAFSEISGRAFVTLLDKRDGAGGSMSEGDTVRLDLIVLADVGGLDLDNSSPESETSITGTFAYSNLLYNP